MWIRDKKEQRKREIKQGHGNRNREGKMWRRVRGNIEREEGMKKQKERIVGIKKKERGNKGSRKGGVGNK